MTVFLMNKTFHMSDKTTPDRASPRPAKSIAWQQCENEFASQGVCETTIRAQHKFPLESQREATDKSAGTMNRNLCSTPPGPIPPFPSQKSKIRSL